MEMKPELEHLGECALTIQENMRIINTEFINMRRLNITLPEIVAMALDKVSNKSRFIAEAVLEKIAADERRKLDAELSAAYQAVRTEDARVDAEWELVTIKDWS
jgi:hypothetical protein